MGRTTQFPDVPLPDGTSLAISRPLTASAIAVQVGWVNNDRWGRRRAAVYVGFVAALVVLLASEAASASTYVHLWLGGVINPVKVRYVKRAFAQARAQGSEFVLVSIDTPGGLVSSMQEITSEFTNSPIPVVVFVEPTSAQATSAGAFIVLASDVAAMAPGTRIGAAHPVAEGKPLEGALDDKATNSLVSLAKSLAARRGRSASFAEDIVRKSLSFTAEEAKSAGAVEFISPDVPDLLSHLDGYRIEGEGRQTTLSTKGIGAIPVPMSWVERLLDALADPTIASILISLGVMGIAYEFSTPGVGMGGIVGVVCLLLGLMALSALPLHLGGLFLLIAGLVAIGLEVKVQTHGLLAVGGVIALVLGGIVLVDPESYFGGTQRMDWRIFAPFAIGIAAAFLLFATVGVRALRKPAISGVEALTGTHGFARSPFTPEGDAFCGMVFADGARWQAVSDSPLQPGDEIVVVAVLAKPTRLRVTKVEKGAS